MLRWTVVVLLMGWGSGLGLAAPGADPNPAPGTTRPRRIEFRTPLAGCAIVAPSGMANGDVEAVRIQQAIRARTGLQVEVLSDRAVTSHDSWLIKEEYLSRPLIVLGNATDSRAVYALSTRYLTIANHRWPGVEKFCNRTVLEPFRRDVNQILLEASNPEAMSAATDSFIARIQECTRKENATLERFRKLGATNGEWKPVRFKKTGIDFSGSIEEIKQQFLKKYGTSVKIGDGGVLWYDALRRWLAGGDDSSAKYSAVVLLVLHERKAPYLTSGMSHYHYDSVVKTLQLCFNSGVLDEKQINTFEAALAMNAAYPRDYNADHALDFKGSYLTYYINRHSTATIANFRCGTDYVLNHCELTAPMRAQIAKRHDAYVAATGEISGSYRSDAPTSEQTDCAVMYLNLMSLSGQLQWVREGWLKRACEYWLATNNNLGFYCGMGAYIGSSKLYSNACGKNIFGAAAFYYRDPRYQWLYKNIKGQASCRTSASNSVFNDDMAEEFPRQYTGVFAIQPDPRLYKVRQDSAGNVRQPSYKAYRSEERAAEKLFEQAWFRDGFLPEDPCLILAGNHKGDNSSISQLNAILQYTDLGKTLLFTHTQFSDSWRKSTVSVSNGRECLPSVYCEKKALINSDGRRISAIASVARHHGNSDWTRSIVHRKGHFFAVIDEVQALYDDEYDLTCRWRAVFPATLEDSTWTVDAGDDVKMTLIPAGYVDQNASHPPADSHFRPYILEQKHHAAMQKGDTHRFMNVFYASGPTRPDHCIVKRVDDRSMLVHGEGTDWDEVALIGTHASPAEIGALEILADIFYVDGEEIVAANCRRIRIGSQTVFESDTPANKTIDTAQYDLGKVLRETYAALGDAPQPVARGRTLPDEGMETAWTFVEFRHPDPWCDIASITLGDNWQKGYVPPATLVDPNTRFKATRFYHQLPRFPGAKGVAELTLDLGAAQRVKDVIFWGGSTQLEPMLSYYRDHGDVRFKVQLRNTAEEEWREADPAVLFEYFSFPNAHYTWAGKVSRYLLRLGDTPARYIKVMIATDKKWVFFQKIAVAGAAKQKGLRLELGVLPAGEGSNIAVKTAAGEVGVLSPHDGRQLWSRRFDNCTITAWQCILSDDGESGEVIVGTTDNMFYRLDGATGEDIAQIDFGEIYRKEKPDSWTRWHCPYTFELLAAVPSESGTDIIGTWASGISTIGRDGSVEKSQGYPYNQKPAHVCDVTVGMGRRSTAYLGPGGFYIKDAKHEPILWLKKDAYRFANPLYEVMTYTEMFPVRDAHHQGIFLLNYGTVWWIPRSKPEAGWLKRSDVPLTAGCLTQNDEGATEVAVAFVDGFVRIYDIASGDVLRKVYTGPAQISRMVWMGDGLVTVSAAGVSRFDGALERVAYKHVQGNAAVRLGDRIFVGDSSDGTVHAIDVTR